MPIQRPPDSKLVLMRLLKQSREAVGISQIDMAAALSLQQADISKIERGVRKIDVMELRLWALAVGSSFEGFARQLDEAWSQMDRTHHHLSGRQ